MKIAILDPAIKSELDVIADGNYNNGDMAYQLKLMKSTLDSCLNTPFRLFYAARAYLNT